MADILPYLISVMIIVFIIILNHKKQKNSLDNFLKDAEEMQPILLLQSVERKLQNLYAMLYENGIKPAVINGGEATGHKQLFIQELEQLEKAYIDKEMSLGTYSDKLQVLQMKVNRLNTPV